MNSMTESIGARPVAALALRYFRNGFYCSEAILRAFNETYDLGLSKEHYKIATGFGSGLGESGCTCGSISGAVMSLGLIAGRTEAYQSERIVYQTVKQLHDLFKNKHRALCCRVLTKSVAWGSAQHKLHCEQFMTDVACWTDDLMQTYLREYLPVNGMRSIPSQLSLTAWVRRGIFFVRNFFNR